MFLEYLNLLSKGYCNIYCLDSFSGKVKQKLLDIDSDFCSKHNLYDQEFDNKFDNKIFDLAKKDSSSKDALLALRGRISFPIFQKVNEIFRKYTYQFENEKINLNDMLIIVLDDSGEKYLRIPLKIDSKKNNFLRKLFSWETIMFMKENNILKPFSAEVIADFNPKLSNLNTWSQNKVKGNYELKKYLKECGILLISPWSLIADSSKKRIIISWREYGEGNLSEKDLEKLYESYLVEYKKAKQDYKNRTGKISGWTPDEDFLKSLNPPQKNTEILLLIDKALRKYISSPYDTRSFYEYEENQIENRLEDEEEYSSKDLSEIIKNVLRRNSTNIVNQIIKKDSAKWIKDPSRKNAWILYGEGLSQREIASKCDHKQGWVSKLIPENKISEEIAQESAFELLKKNEFNKFKEDPESLDKLLDGLKSYLVFSEDKNNISILRNTIYEVISK